MVCNYVKFTDRHEKTEGSTAFRLYQQVCFAH